MFPRKGFRTEEYRPHAVRPYRFIFLLLALVAFVSCRAPQKMASQPSYKPYEGSSFFEDGTSARPLVDGTVARGTLKEDAFLHTAKVNNALVNSFPFEITAERLQRGQERFNIYCAPCHSRTGNGRGMIVQRGYKAPQSFHAPAVRQQPVGYYVDIMTNGFGVMPPYASQVSIEDRWAIAAYIRVLQMSQNATMAEVPADKRAQIR